jgi:hypothetical protein
MKPIFLLVLIFSNMKGLVGSYIGGCKNGLANGNGEANGAYHYKGAFKDGMPNGTGSIITVKMNITMVISRMG